MSLRYTKPGRVDNEDTYGIDGWVTELIDPTTTFGDAVKALVLHVTDREYGHVPILMTVRSHWSGYSEFTITNTWSEIILTAPDWNFEREWPSMGDFLRAMADANPAADR